MDNTTIGIDVSKAKLDICFLSSGECIKISNDIQGFKLLVKYIKKNYIVKRIIIEHTGNYQRDIVNYLQKYKFIVCVVNPSKVRAFAKAAGILAKTDKIDAWVLAKYGEMFTPEENKIQDENVIKLRELTNFRRQIVETCKLFKTRLEKKTSTFIAREINKLIKNLEKQEKEISKKIKEFIADNTEMMKKSQILLTIDGFGEQTVNTLLSNLPELGQIEKNKLSALCGIAPINHDSGKLYGIRSIYGGSFFIQIS